MTKYYHSMIAKNWHFSDPEREKHFYEVRDKIFKNMDGYYRSSPDTPTALLKSRLHTLMAEECEPVIFENNPFYFEIGMREANSWGLSEMAPSNWIRRVKRAEIVRKHPIVEEIERCILPLFARDKLFMCHISSAFDIDHHTLGYKKLFSCGIGGIIKETKGAMEKFSQGSEQYLYCTAILESCNALLRISKKFGEKAREILLTEKNEKHRRCLNLIADTADQIPLNPPKTFYEGLQMLLFTREVIATLENIGISSFGQVDLLLGDLYDNDIKNGQACNLSVFCMM